MLTNKLKLHGSYPAAIGNCWAVSPSLTLMTSFTPLHTPGVSVSQLLLALHVHGELNHLTLSPITPLFNNQH